MIMQNRQRNSRQEIDEQEFAIKSHNYSVNEDVVFSVNEVSKKFCRDLKHSLLYGVQDIASEILALREKSDKITIFMNSRERKSGNIHKPRLLTNLQRHLFTFGAIY